MNRILTIVLALFLPALVIGYVAINPPEDSPYDLPQTLVPEGIFPTTSAEVRSEAVVPTAAFTRVVVAGGTAIVLSTAVETIRALGYPTVAHADTEMASAGVYHRTGFEAEAATIAAALDLPMGSVLLTGTVTDADDQGDVIVVFGGA